MPPSRHFFSTQHHDGKKQEFFDRIALVSSSLMKRERTPFENATTTINNNDNDNNNKHRHALDQVTPNPT
jgi:hypothetical protein